MYKVLRLISMLMRRNCLMVHCTSCCLRSDEDAIEFSVFGLVSGVILPYVAWAKMASGLRLFTCSMWILCFELCVSSRMSSPFWNCRHGSCMQQEATKFTDKWVACRCRKRSGCSLDVLGAHELLHPIVGGSLLAGSECHWMQKTHL